MSVWRRKALACLPEFRHELQRKDTSIYEVFFTLLSETILAHQQKDNTRLREYYSFAEWCFSQTDKSLWNAAGVSFYEKLIDREETTHDMSIWVKKSIYIKVRGLLVFRAGEDKVKELDKRYHDTYLIHDSADF